MTRQVKSVKYTRYRYRVLVKSHLGEPGHTRDTRAHGHTDHTDELTTNPTHTNAPAPHNRATTGSAADSYNKQPQDRRSPGGRSRPLPAANSEEAGTGAALMTACPGHVELAFHHR